MIKIKCEYANGDVITTKFNGTYTEARDYFLGRVFNLGTISDNPQKCISVEHVEWHDE